MAGRARTQRRRPPPRRPASASRSIPRGKRAPVEPQVVDGPPITRADVVGAGIVGLVAAALFATTFSSHVAFGDAPESVAGVRTLGVIHAPGYPSYVLVARLFGAVLPVGSWALRVNLFSVVCATLTIALVFL